MNALPNNASTLDLLRWVSVHPNQPFDPNMVISAKHVSDWQWQAVLGQMEDLRRQNYITRLQQDSGGSTYWVITTSGLNYLKALESFTEPKVVDTEPAIQSLSIANDPITVPSVSTAETVSVVPRKRYFWPFIERTVLRIRKLISWEEMPTHLAAHLIYDGVKMLIGGASMI